MASSNTEMLARVMYEADGFTSVFKITYPYISARDIFVFVNKEEALFEFVDNETIELNTVPTSGSVVTIQRQTERKKPLVDFQDGSVLLETDLDLAVTQTVYLSQEAYDFSTQSLRIDSSGVYDAQDIRLANVSDPVEPRDAVTLRYLEGSILSLQEQVSGVEEPASAQFSTVSWHEQTINTIVEVPSGVNAWSFGPSVEIGDFGKVTINEGSYWTIAHSEESSTGFNGNYDYGVI